MGCPGKVFGSINLHFQPCLRIVISDPSIYIFQIQCYALKLCCIGFSVLYRRCITCFGSFWHWRLFLLSLRDLILEILYSFFVFILNTMYLYLGHEWCIVIYCCFPILCAIFLSFPLWNITKLEFFMMKCQHGPLLGLFPPFSRLGLTQANLVHYQVDPSRLGP